MLIDKLGLNTTIEQEYVEDSPCHPEVYVPKKLGTGPVYVKRTDKLYIKSCGEGKGPNAIPDLLEFRIALEILDTDPNYMKKGHYFIPRKDYSLPIFDIFRGKIEFENQYDKLKLIDEILQGKHESRYI